MTRWPPRKRCILIMMCVIVFTFIAANMKNAGTLQRNIGRTAADTQVPMVDKWVILHTYMRGGSTLLGKIFEKDPDAFYLFEPLFQVYQSMTGTRMDFHPLHIFSKDASTPRKPTEEETLYSVDKLQKMMKCEYHDLPIQVVVNRHMSFSEDTEPFYKCLGSQAAPLENCYRKLGEVCPRHVETAFQNGCHLFMSAVRNDSSIVTWNQKLAKKFPDGFLKVSEYSKCFESWTEKASKCLPELLNRCDTTQIRAVKLIRGSIPLLKRMMTNKNSYLIYGIRDPRGILMSRLHTKVTRMVNYTIVQEGRLLCNRMLSDLAYVLQLQRQQPSRVKIIKYEEMAENSLKISKDVYAFIDAPLPVNVSNYLNASVSAGKQSGSFKTLRRNSKATASAWRRKISESLKSDLNSVCSSFLQKAGYAI